MSCKRAGHDYEHPECNVPQTRYRIAVYNHPTLGTLYYVLDVETGTFDTPYHSLDAAEHNVALQSADRTPERAS
jgi:hypothetical protein